MISKPEFKLGNDRMQMLPLDNNECSYICHCAEMDFYIDRNFSWHWHNALEINYVAEGEAEIKSLNKTLHLKKGDAAFINSNVTHSIGAWNNMRKCKIYAHVFDMHFLSGMYSSIFERKYLLPVIRNRAVPIYLIHADSYEHIQMLEKITHMIRLAEEEPFGYEFELRSDLSRFWCMFFAETAELRASQKEIKNADDERLKQMIDYIQKNYMEKIELKEIAASADIGTRECSRCFVRCIGISPINYLISVRVRMAAQMLLTTDKTVLAISEDCGFSSSSYFGKVFRDHMKCTPAEYRRINRY